jgi:hypothetical protein
MADYYPLLSKAVAGLDPGTPEARQSIYDRARMALTRQMASMDPPVAQAVIDREIAALDAVVQRIEREVAGLEPEEPEALLAPVVPAAAPRPQVMRRESTKSRKPMVAVGLALGFVAVIAIATLAFLRRNEPPAMAQRPLPTAQAPQTAPAQVPTKTVDRVQPGTTETPARIETPPRPETPARPPQATAPQPAAPIPPPAQTPVQPPPQSAPLPPGLAAPQPPAQPQIAVANRMALILEGKEDPQKLDVKQGTVVWRTEMVSGGQGQPLQQAIRAVAEAPELRMRAEITIQKNRDAAFPASHTIQVRFSYLGQSEIGAVQSLSQIEFRQSENQPGYPLAGQGIAVMENVFLVALAQLEPSQSRNIEMMKARPLIYMEFQLVGGRRGAMVLEKGVSGQQVFDDAFRNWQ